MSKIVGPDTWLQGRTCAWPKRAARGHTERGYLYELGDPVTRRQRLYGLLAQRLARAVDPAITVTYDDGYATEGPVVSIQYALDSPVSFVQQEQALACVLEALRITPPRPFAVLARPEDGYRFPFIEVPCDLEHHRYMIFLVASAPPERRAMLMEYFGILPAVIDLSRDLLADPYKEASDG